MPITSSRNPIVRYVRSLDRPQTRRAERAYVVEGIRLVSEAFETGQRATLALYDPASLSRSDRGSRLLDALHHWPGRGVEVDRRVLSAAAETESPSGVVAVLPLPESGNLRDRAGDAFGILLAGVADPGNTGTILRTAAAAGVDFVISLSGTVDLFAPKVVRAGMGAHFRVPLFPGLETSEIWTALPRLTPVALDVDAERSIYDMRWPEQTLLVVGSEAHGIPLEARATIDLDVRIPMMPGVESLNAAMAASIAIYSALGPKILATQRLE